MGILSLVLVFAACALPGNNQVATYRKVGDHYSIEVYGTRAAWSHDLTGIQSYGDGWAFDVPRIDGTIDGKEIPRPPKTYPLVGTVTIQGSQMVISLSLDKYDLNRQDPIDWNGRYTLVEKKSDTPKGERGMR